jgi:excinuclease UvrABC helicase subunit UvrB
MAGAVWKQVANAPPDKAIAELDRRTRTAARRLHFQAAAQLRNRIKELRRQQIYKG